MGEREIEDINSISMRRQKEIKSDLEHSQPSPEVSPAEPCLKDIFSDEPEIIHRGILGLSYQVKTNTLVPSSLGHPVFKRLKEIIETYNDSILLFHVYALISEMTKNKIYVHMFYKAFLYEPIIENLNKNPFIVPLQLSLSILSSMYMWIKSSAKNLREKYHYFDLLIWLANHEQISSQDLDLIIGDILVASARFTIDSEGLNIDEIRPYFDIFNNLSNNERAFVYANISALDLYNKLKEPSEIDISIFCDRIIPIMNELDDDKLEVLAISMLALSSTSDDQCIHLVQQHFFESAALTITKTIKNSTLCKIMVAVQNVATVKMLAELFIQSPLSEAIKSIIEDSNIDVRKEIIYLYALLCATHQMDSYVREIPNILTITFDLIETFDENLSEEQQKYIYSALYCADVVIKYKIASNDDDFEDVDFSILEDIGTNASEQISVLANQILKIIPN